MNALKNCYDKDDEDGVEKDRCYKRAIGLRMKFSELEPEERKEKTRDYLVTLLYDLEERVEKGVEENLIDPEEGAEIIDYIVDIKEKILNGASKAEIRMMMQELKLKWRAAVSAEVESE